MCMKPFSHADGAGAAAPTPSTVSSGNRGPLSLAQQGEAELEGRVERLIDARHVVAGHCDLRTLQEGQGRQLLGEVVLDVGDRLRTLVLVGDGSLCRELLVEVLVAEVVREERGGLVGVVERSEERRVGKGWRCRGWAGQQRTKSDRRPAH